MFIIGIDAGGTRTRAVLASLDGTVQHLTQGGGGNYQNIGLEGMAKRMEQVLQPFKAIGQGKVLSLCLAAAGAGRQDDQIALKEMLTQGKWADKTIVISDAQAALEGAHAGNPGIIVIAGTGSIAMGKNAAEQWGRTGGWGPILGDRGSGYAIALEGLRAVLEAKDGSGDQTALTTSLQQVLAFESWEELVSQVYRGQLDRETIAALAPYIFHNALQGDLVSQRIIDSAGKDLGRLVWALARTLEMSTPAVSCLGGVFNARRQLWPTLVDELTRKNLHPQWCKPYLVPVLGAVLVAARQVDQVFSELHLQRLKAGCPLLQ